MKTIMVIILTGALASCGTVDGIGEDISNGARTVQSWF